MLFVSMCPLAAIRQEHRVPETVLGRSSFIAYIGLLMAKTNVKSNRATNFKATRQFNDKTC
ncbi:hypothetical protein CPB84DRAFT_1760278 [Gymnopilus junonius]|uniref:Uncharacterized protein n=1 Tax=Gymnopilus junonius TaxID=109634 RepID=A0A9P5P3N1_GYMJU|nr:hypothetical protein CPB84DRAFT_1760278 [Gymnopilus junonius]